MSSGELFGLRCEPDGRLVLEDEEAAALDQAVSGAMMGIFFNQGQVCCAGSRLFLDARVKEIGQQYDKLTFKYTGPWPPYNFVNIRLKLERAH